MALLPANRTTPVPPYIGIGRVGSARNALRGTTVSDQTVNNGVAVQARRPPGATTVMIARSQRTLANAESTQANENLKLSTRA